MPVATKETKPRKLRENTAFSEEPYASSREHLFDELRWLNRLLAIYVLRLRHVHFYEKLRDFRGLFIADDEIDALMAAGIFEKNGKVSEDDRSKNIKKLRTQALSQRKQIDNRVEQSLANNKNLPLKQLQKIFNLTDFEVHTLLICIAPLLDARYKKLYAYLQNDITRKIASLDLILDLLCEGPEERLHNLQSFHKTSPLRHYSLLHGAENNSDAPIFHDIYQVDPRIIHYILGQRVVDERLESHLRFLPPLAWENVVIANETKARFQMLVDSILSRQEAMILYLSGREGVGKKTIARAVCADLALPVAVTDLRGLFQDGDGFQENLRLILREGLLQPCALCFEHFEKLEHAAAENPALFTSFIHELENLGWIIFICSENPMPAQLLDLKTVYAFEMPAPAYKMQVGLWKRCLASAAS
ncbi:MAG: hypothetical protein ACE5I1_16695, partial [bacterium]